MSVALSVTVGLIYQPFSAAGASGAVVPGANCKPQLAAVAPPADSAGAVVACWDLTARDSQRE